MCGHGFLPSRDLRVQMPDQRRIIRRSSERAFILTWAWSQLAGTSEVALRIPSVLAMIATAILLFRMALRVADKRTAAYVILLLASLSPVSFAAADAA